MPFSNRFAHSFATRASGIAAALCLVLLASVYGPARAWAQGAARQAPPAYAPGPASGEPQLDLPRVQMSASMYRIDAQVARSPAQRQVGLMFRRQMPEHEGMLFVFEQPGVQCFWMQNTLIPLTAAFVDDDGTIVNLADMQPQTTDSHCSAKPVRYVLEMNQGWFDKRRIQPGVRLRGGPFTLPPGPAAGSSTQPAP